MPDAAFAERYAALSARDARFDGQFIAGVTTTGIYCRPSCPAVTAKPQNVRFFRTAAAAHEAGLRACKRCQPDAVPGSPEWNLRDDLASRAMRLIDDGVVERDGVEGLARRLGYSSRHLGRVLRTELGAGPLALARAHRAHTARTLLAVTELPITDVAFAAGFGSLRQFNDTIAELYRTSPTELRALAHRGSRALAPEPAGVGTTPGTALTLRLPAREPFDGTGLLHFFADHAVPGLESEDPAEFARTFALPRGEASVRVRVDADRPGVIVRARLDDLADVPALSARLRRLFDLDADALAVDRALAADPVLAPLVSARPGVRLPGSVDGAETLFRTLLGQQISVAAARTVTGRLVTELGGGRFPSALQFAEHGAEALRGPARRIATIVAAAHAILDGRLRLDPETRSEELRAALLAVPGIGPWTAGYVAMRVLGHPDTFLAEDLIVRQTAAAHSLPGSAAALAAHAARWAPWRSYATMHLWRARPGPPPPRRASTSSAPNLRDSDGADF